MKIKCLFVFFFNDELADSLGLEDTYFTTYIKTKLKQNTNFLLHLAISDSSAPRVNLGSKISALDGKIVKLLSLDVKVPNYKQTLAQTKTRVTTFKC